MPGCCRLLRKHPYLDRYGPGTRGWVPIRPYKSAENMNPTSKRHQTERRFERMTETGNSMLVRRLDSSHWYRDSKDMHVILTPVLSHVENPGGEMAVIFCGHFQRSGESVLSPLISTLTNTGCSYALSPFLSPASSPTLSPVSPPVR